MTTADFSYSDTRASDLDRVRFHINDTENGSGPLPGDSNFTDSEIEDMISVEGDWRRAVAAGLERLSVAWRRHPTFQADGVSISRSHISRGYLDEAKVWRRAYGYANGTRVKARGVIRVDGYSDDISSTEVDN